MPGTWLLWQRHQDPSFDEWSLAPQQWCSASFQPLALACLFEQQFDHCPTIGAFLEFNFRHLLTTPRRTLTPETCWRQRNHVCRGSTWLPLRAVCFNATPFSLFDFSSHATTCLHVLEQTYPANIYFPHRTLDIPFPDARLASVALQALRVDKELSSLVKRDLSTVATDGSANPSVLRVEYKAATNRMLRVAVNSFLDSLALVLEVQEELDVDVLQSRKADSESR